MSIRSQNKIKIEGGMSSMTDLVFLLLIFFIILSALAKNAVDVDLPSGGAVAPSKQALASVVIKPDNTIFLNKKVIQVERLEQALIEATAKDKEKVVELYGDKKSDFGIAVKVIDIAKKNKLKIVIMTKK